MAGYDKEAYAAKMKAKTEELTSKLETGMKDLYNSDKYKDYLKSMACFHNYSRRNIMLIHFQLPHATKIASSRLWKEEFSRFPKKGETALYIYAPIGSKKPETKLFEKIDPETKVPVLDENGKPVMEELTTLGSGPRFKLVPVFDVSQTGGEPLPELVENLTANVEHYEALLNALKAVSPLPIEFETMKPNQDGYCRFGEKIGIREGMSEAQTIAAIVHEITHAKLHDKNNLAETDTQKSSEVQEIEAESIAYVVCQRLGIETGANSFGYLAEWSDHDKEMKGLKSSLDIIRNESAILIDAVVGRFQAICKERDITLTAEAQPAAQAQLEKQQEPQYTTQASTENIAGVDFTVEEVIPETPKPKRKPPLKQENYEKLSELFPLIANGEYNYLRLESTGYMPLSVEMIGDNQISIMHSFSQNGDLMYDPMMVFEVDHKVKTATAVEFQQSNPPLYQRIDEDGIWHSIDGNGNERTIKNLETQLNSFASQWFDNIGVQDYSPIRGYLTDDKDIDPVTYFNSDGKPFNIGYMYESGGTTLLNNLDTDNTEPNNVGRLAKVAHVDSSRKVAFFEENLPPAVIEIIENVKLVNEKPLQPEATQTELPPAPQQSAEPMPDPSISTSDRDAYGYVYESMLPLNQDRAVELFNQDCQIYLLFNDDTESAVNDSSEILAHDGIFGIEKENWQKFLETQHEQEIPTQAETLKSQIPIYKHSAGTARDNGELEIYRQNLKINSECGQAIDQSIRDNNTELYHYDLKTAVRSVIDEYGVDRVAFILAANVQDADYDGRFSNATKEWAKGIDIPIPPKVYLQSHKTILEGYVNRFREAEKEKPSVMTTLAKNEQKAKQQFDNKSGKNMPEKDTSTKKIEGEDR